MSETSPIVRFALRITAPLWRLRRLALWTETAFWDGWLLRRQKSGEIARLLDPARLVRQSLWPAIERCASDPVRILEVGAGPIASAGFRHPSRRIELLPTDVLAADYDRILARRGIVPPVRTVPADAERLVERFGSERFDLVYAENCVDHMADPLRALREMACVVRVGGSVVLEHSVDEGVHQGYAGLHQWNLTTESGAFVVWNRSARHDVSRALFPWCEVHAATRDGTLFVEIRKLAAASTVRP